jgi:hypothetical protein
MKQADKNSQGAAAEADALQQTSDRAAVLIQRRFRSSWPQSVSWSMRDEDSLPAEQQASDRAAVLIQRQFRSSLPQSATAVALSDMALSDMPDVTETTCYEDEDDDDFVEETTAEEPKHRSGNVLWGVAGAAMVLVAPKVLGAVMGGGSPVDEDDLITGSMVLKGNAGGAGGGGAGAGGAGGGGAGASGAGAGAGAGGGGVGVTFGTGAATATASTAQ